MADLPSSFIPDGGGVSSLPKSFVPDNVVANVSPWELLKTNPKDVVNTPPDASNSGVRGGRSEHSDQIQDTVIDLARPIVAGAGAAATGGLGAIPAYAGIDALLQKLKSHPSTSISSQVLNLKPGGIASTLANSGEQFALGKLLEGVTSKGGRVVNAIKNVDQPEIMDFKPTTGQALKASGNNITGNVASTIENLSLGSKQAALDRAGGAGFTQALKLANNEGFNYSRNPNAMVDMIKGDLPGYDPESITASSIDKVIKDPDKLQNVLTAGQNNGVGVNLKKSLQGYQFMKMFNDAATRDVSTNPSFVTDNVKRVNTKALNDAWLDPAMQDSYTALYGKAGKDNITQFIKNLEVTQGNQSASAYPRRLAMIAGGFELAHSLLNGNIVSGLESAAGTTGIYIAASQMGKLLTNPATARIAVALAGDGPLGISQQMAGRAITRALNGAIVATINSDGTKTPARIVNDKLVPVQGQDQ